MDKNEAHPSTLDELRRDKEEKITTPAMRRGFVYCLHPTPEQEEMFMRTTDATRFIYNWGIAQLKEQSEKYQADAQVLKDTHGVEKLTREHKKELHEKYPFPNFYTFARDLTPFKKTEEGAFLAGVNNGALQCALRDLDSGVKHFLRRIKKGETPGYPRFKSYFDNDLSFRSAVGLPPEKITHDQIRIPNIGWVKYNKSRPYQGIIKQITIRKVLNKWYIALSCLIPTDSFIPEKPERCALIDFTITDNKSIIAVTYGTSTYNYPIPSFYGDEESRLTTLIQAMQSKQKDGRNREKCRKRIAKIHRDIFNRRKDFLHKLSKDLVLSFYGIQVKKIDSKELFETEESEKVKKRVEGAWHSFTLMLKYKCETYRKYYEEI